MSGLAAVGVSGDIPTPTPGASTNEGNLWWAYAWWVFVDTANNAIYAQAQHLHRAPWQINADDVTVPSAGTMVEVTTTNAWVLAPMPGLTSGTWGGAHVFFKSGSMATAANSRLVVAPLGVSADDPSVTGPVMAITFPKPTANPQALGMAPCAMTPRRSAPLAARLWRAIRSR